MRILGLITARGGSKIIPRKNLRRLAGKPLIAHTIEAALEAGVLDRVVVSTEDPEIAEVALEHGAEVPFRRPFSLATDEAGSMDVIGHALEALGSTGYHPDALMLLQPTSPLRTSDDIRCVVERLKAGAPAVVSVTPVKQHPFWMKEVEPETLRISPFVDVRAPTRRQDLPPLFIINGAAYAATMEFWGRYNGFYGRETEAFIMPAERSVDLDDELDWLVLEQLMTKGEVQ